MIDYKSDVVDLTHLELQSLTEKEEAIFLLGCGDNYVLSSIHYKILDSGVRECFTQNDEGQLCDWSSEFTLAFGGSVLWNLYFGNTKGEK